MTTKKIIKQIAKQNGVTYRQVKLDMEEAIRQAMLNSDPQVQAIWKEISPNEKAPSLGVFLKFCAEKINN